MKRKEVIVKTLTKCVRCGGTHTRVKFTLLTNAVSQYKWWTMCPTLKEPILLSRTIVGKGQ